MHVVDDRQDVAPASNSSSPGPDVVKWLFISVVTALILATVSQLQSDYKWDALIPLWAVAVVGLVWWGSRRSDSLPLVQRWTPVAAGLLYLGATVALTVDPGLPVVWRVTPPAVAFALYALLLSTADRQERSRTLQTAPTALGLGVAILGAGVAMVGLAVAALVRSDVGVGVAMLGFGVAILGFGVTVLVRSVVGFGVAMLGFGVAMLGFGVAALVRSEVGFGVAMLGAGVAALGLGVAALVGSDVGLGVAALGLGVAVLGFGMAALVGSDVGLGMAAFGLVW